MEREQARKNVVAEQKSRSRGVVAGKSIALAKRKEEYEAKQAKGPASTSLGMA